MKKFLQDLIAKKEAGINAIRQALINEDNKEKRAELGATLETLLTELQEAKEKLAEVEADEAASNEDEGAERGFNPMGTYQVVGNTQRSNDVDPLSTMEYRKAFKDFVQRGIRSEKLNVRAAEQVSSDLGVLLPNTIVDEVMQEVKKVYGQLYSRVKKTSVKGGVEYPIGAFSANLVWSGTGGTDTEHGVSEKQKAGAITGSVTFSYHIGEIRIAQSLLESIVTVEAFEAEVVKALVEAYVKAMDVAITDGTGAGQPTGIFANTSAGIQRVPAKNIIEFTADDMADWKQWKKKLFAKIPLAMRGLSPEFVMTANTFESNIETLEDTNGQPVARELSNPVNGATECKFWAKNVVLVEEGASIKNFDEAANGEYFGIYWVPEKAYAINTNMQFGYKKYFDENTNQYITKALVIVDGKILDPNYIYLLKKKA